MRGLPQQCWVTSSGAAKVEGVEEMAGGTGATASAGEREWMGASNAEVIWKMTDAN